LEVDDGARADNECEGFASIVGQVCVWMSRPGYPGDIYIQNLAADFGLPATMAGLNFSQSHRKKSRLTSFPQRDLVPIVCLHGEVYDHSGMRSTDDLSSMSLHCRVCANVSLLPAADCNPDTISHGT